MLSSLLTLGIGTHADLKGKYDAKERTAYFVHKSTTTKAGQNIPANGEITPRQVFATKARTIGLTSEEIYMVIETALHRERTSRIYVVSCVRIV